MSRIFALVAVAGSMVAASMLVGLSASPSSAVGEKAAAVTTKKKVKIGISVPAADHGWTAGVGYWAKKAMELYPDVEWVYAAANTPDKQIGDVDTMLTKGIDGLVILATESAPLTPAAKKAHEAGVFIVNVDRGFLDPVADIFLEGDNKAFGRKSAQFVAEKMKKEGRKNLVILTGIPCTVDTDRVTAALEVFKSYPEIKVLGQQPAMWNREKGMKVMETFLTKFDKIDAVWAQDDDIMMGAIKAIKDAGREKELFIVGGAGMKEAIKMVMDNDPMVPANITYPPSMIAAGVQLAVSVLRDGKRDEIMKFMPRHLMLDVELVTPANAKSFYFPDSVY